MLAFRNFRSFGRPATSCLAGIRRSLFISPGEETPSYTTLEMMESFQKIVGSPRYFSANQETENRKKLMELLPRDRSELPDRRMKDSFVSAIIPLKSNLVLREYYLSSHGTVRIGRLFEDMDVFAGFICYKHILNPRSEGKTTPFACVTVLVDNMHVHPTDIRPEEDIRLSGHVSSVGKSSIEVAVLLDQKNEEGVWKKLTEVWFVFAARNALNTGGVFVNPLVADTKEEDAYIKEGEKRSIKRRLVQSESLLNKPPNTEETAIVHKLFSGAVESSSQIRKTGLQPNTENMSDWVLNSLFLCHPQYRNRFNKIFGGFIMRQAFEMAYSTVYQFSKSKCKIVYVDDILFQKPVEIGSLLRFKATVAYVEGNYIHIPVMAQVLKPETNEKSVTNVFQYTFLSLSSSPPPLILPKTYLEAMKYLEARRHFLEMKATYQAAA